MQEQKRSHSNRQTLLFVVLLCTIAATILSILAAVLKKPQQEARQLYKSKQLLIAARILSYEEQFQLSTAEDLYIPATFDTKTDLLVPAKEKHKAKDRDILTLYQMRVKPRLTDANGNIYTFEEANIDMQEYLQKNEKIGYANLPYKLLYIIEKNLPPSEITPNTLPYAYIIPVNGYGLWDAIYAYLALGPDANTVIGTTWYDQQETPGLGGNIALPSWQEQFGGKHVFQESKEGSTDFQRAPLGITVVKGTVKEVYGTTPKAQSAVDGIAGASITIQGVTEAYRQSLTPYRPFLIKAHERYVQHGKKDLS